VKFVHPPPILKKIEIFKKCDNLNGIKDVLEKITLTQKISNVYFLILISCAFQQCIQISTNPTKLFSRYEHYYE